MRALILSLCVTLLSSCGVSIDGWSLGSGEQIRGSGARLSERRELEPFDAISVSGSFHAVVEVGGPQEVSIVADDNLLEIVETEVSGGRLRVSTTRSYSTRESIELRVRVPELRSFSASGSHEAELHGLAGERLELEVSGSNTLSARGAVGELVVDASGSARLELAELRAERARVEVAGSARAALHAVESLDLDLSGSADVTYRGRPRLEVRRSGSGSVRPVDAELEVEEE